MKLLKLTGNEFIKLFSKKSSYLIIIFAVILCILFPYLNYRAQEIVYTSHYQENLDYEKQWVTETLAKYDESEESRLANIYDYCYQRASLEIVNLKIQAGIDSYNDWRDSESYYLTDKYIEYYYIEYYLNGSTKYIEAINNSGTAASIIDSTALDYYYNYGSKTKLRARYNVLASDIAQISASIVNNDATYFNQYYLDSAKETIAQTESSIADLQKLINKTSDADTKEKYTEQLSKYQTQLSKLNELLFWAQYRVDNAISRSSDDWKNLCVNNITYAIEAQYEEPLTKEEFDAQSVYNSQWQNMTYEEYLDYAQQQKDTQSDNITLYTYSLDNNIPPEEYAQSTRQQIDNIYFVLIIVSLAGIIIGAPLVSQEYNKGTIRLLLTRPVKRYKILASKLLMLLCMCAGLLAVCATVYILSDIAFFGIQDFRYPVLSIANGAIVSETILQTVLPVLLKCTVSVFFIVSMAFAISVILKSTVVGVALPFAFLSFSGLAAFILISLGYYKLAQYTVFAYVNLENIINQTGLVGSLISSTPQLNLSVNFGFAQLAVFGVIMLAMSFWVLCKRDVKN
jgi:ABC-2 type transport system permease protein